MDDLILRVWRERTDQGLPADFLFGDLRALPLRFWTKVGEECDTGCWIWFRAKVGGYGWFSWQGKSQYTHIVAYEAFIGPIEVGSEIDHLCRVRACCNPAHLEVVTHAVNVERGGVGSASSSRKGIRRGPNGTATHCKRGHERTPENTYITPKGHKQCRACNRENHAKHVAKFRT